MKLKLRILILHIVVPNTKPCVKNTHSLKDTFSNSNTYSYMKHNQTQHISMHFHYEAAYRGFQRGKVSIYELLPISRMFEGCYELSRYAPLMLYTEWYFQSFLKDCVFCVSQYLLFVLLMTSPVEEEALHNLCNPSFNYYAQNNLVKNSTRTKVIYKILFVSNPHSWLYAI